MNRGCPGGVFQSSGGNEVLASALSSSQAMCPNRDAVLGWLRLGEVDHLSAALQHWKQTGTI